MPANQTSAPETLAMLRSAFPAGVAEPEYLPLLSLLVTRMSYRAMANVIAQLTGRDFSTAYHDALKVDALLRESHHFEGIDALIGRLNPHGYQQWLQADE